MEPIHGTHLPGLRSQPGAHQRAPQRPVRVPRRADPAHPLQPDRHRHRVRAGGHVRGAGHGAPVQGLRGHVGGLPDRRAHRLDLVRAHVQAADRVRLPAVHRSRAPTRRSSTTCGSCSPTTTSPAPSFATSGLVLEDKAVVLFLELRKDGLRNCSPNNCDDRGAEVTATVRRLLIDVADLDKVIAATSAPPPPISGPTSPSGSPCLTCACRASTCPTAGPSLRRRCSSPSRPRSARTTWSPRGRAHQAVRRVQAARRRRVPDQPVRHLHEPVRLPRRDPGDDRRGPFMQYYWDLFDDLLAAYDELRWKGVDLMCACCPPEGLFPRHLMAGCSTRRVRRRRLPPSFVPSPAVGDCEDRTGGPPAVPVGSWRSWRASPRPPDKGSGPHRAGGATPRCRPRRSRYYYDQDGAPPVYELWDPVKTARRGPTRTSATAPTSTRRPCRLRHRPAAVRPRAEQLPADRGASRQERPQRARVALALKKSHRLPIEVIALRTGAFDENIEVDLSREDCRFQDLETLYDALKSELICFLVKQVQYFYALPARPTSPGRERRRPTIRLLKGTPPEFQRRAGDAGTQDRAL